MIRPEAAAALRRWGEAGAGAALLASGAWLAAAAFGLPRLFGLAMLAAGAVLAVSGLRRARFGARADGPGVVEVVEGRIAYLGPETGGAVALDLLEEVALVRSGGAPAWRLAAADGGAVTIPHGARGADALPEALAPLPGFDGGAMLRALGDPANGTRVVWRRRPLAALT